MTKQALRTLAMTLTMLANLSLVMLFAVMLGNEMDKMQPSLLGIFGPLTMMSVFGLLALVGMDNLWKRLARHR